MRRTQGLAKKKMSKVYTLEEKKKEEIKIKYFAKTTSARIRIDRISSYTPFVYEIKVK